MASLNRVFIMGNLGQDPELRYTQSQSAVVTLNVATTDVRMKDGQRHEQTEWHRVIVWNKQAENCAKYLAKGRSVFVEGRLQTRQWEDKNNQKRYTTEIVATNVQFMPSAGARQQGAGYNQDQQFGGASMGGASMGGGSQFAQPQAAPQFPPAEAAAPATPGFSAEPSDLDDIPF